MKHLCRILLPLFVALLSVTSYGQFEGAKMVSQNDYEQCIELSNETTRVVLEPNVGGRVLVYALNDNNIIYINEDQDGRLYDPERPFQFLCGGRFDMGPQRVIPKRPVLFFGSWEAEITGPRQAIMISQADTATGVQLERRFELDPENSKLTCTQIIRNRSDETKHYCHWGRTFVEGGGISLTPMNTRSRYPKGYIVYGPGNVMDFMPEEEENVRIREGILEILGPPARPKFVMDPTEGWLAYISKDDQLFIKTFKIHPGRIYGEMAANTVSVWYYNDLMCEIEPMGPMEIIKPGEAVSFTENWWLFNYEYPDNKQVSFRELKKNIRHCRNH